MAPYGLNWSINTADSGAVVIPDDFKKKIGTCSMNGDDYEVSRYDKSKRVYKKGIHLGSGSFGNVYQCEFGGSSNYVVKEMMYATDEDFRRTLTEVIIQICIVKETEDSEYADLKLKGPFAPRVYDFSYDATTGKAFLFAEKMHKTVRTLIQGWIKQKEAARNLALVFSRIAVVMSELYNKLSFNHRDFKSDNCMYVRDGAGNFVPRIIDFGFSCIKYNKLTINTTMRYFRYCSVGGRDMTQFLYECIHYNPGLAKEFEPVAKALLTFKRGDKVCDLLKGACGVDRWSNTYDFSNTKSGENPNGHPGIVRNVCLAFLKGGEWKKELAYPRAKTPSPKHVPEPIKVKKTVLPKINEVPVKPVKARHINSRKPCSSAKPNYNPATKRCVKACPKGKIRNSTFKCVKSQIVGSPKLVPAVFPAVVPAPVAPAPVINERKPCSPAKPNYNPVTKRCVKGCPPGQKRDSTFKCKRSSVRDTGAPVAPNANAGKKPCKSEKPNYNPKTRRCVKACPSGKKRGPDFSCVKV